MHNRYNGAQLFHLFHDLLSAKSDSRLDKYHESVLDLIVSGYAYKKSCLDNSGFLTFKPWAKGQAIFEDWTPKDFNAFCADVNEASKVFEHWNQIVSNLTDRRMTYIDARRFSVNFFYRAKEIDWCLIRNEQNRPKGNRRGEEPLYTADKYNALFQSILASGILDDIEHEPCAASMLGGRLQSDLVRHCRRRYRPY